MSFILKCQHLSSSVSLLISQFEINQLESNLIPNSRGWLALSSSHLWPLTLSIPSCCCCCLSSLQHATSQSTTAAGILYRTAPKWSRGWESTCTTCTTEGSQRFLCTRNEAARPQYDNNSPAHFSQLAERDVTLWHWGGNQVNLQVEDTAREVLQQYLLQFSWGGFS